MGCWPSSPSAGAAAVSPSAAGAGVEEPPRLLLLPEDAAGAAAAVSVDASLDAAGVEELPPRLLLRFGAELSEDAAGAAALAEESLDAAGVDEPPRLLLLGALDAAGVSEEAAGAAAVLALFALPPEEGELFAGPLSAFAAAVAVAAAPTGASVGCTTNISCMAPLPVTIFACAYAGSILAISTVPTTAPLFTTFRTCPSLYPAAFAL